ncbi:hypothetical protein [Paenarthrobacter sp. NPDC057981]|uniref:hypothetical protein n=1 Tax=Paenarthrobacter sp. NPDC057981 TaxID=3346297 RepID=UPI0036DF89F5
MKAFIAYSSEAIASASPNDGDEVEGDGDGDGPGDVHPARTVATRSAVNRISQPRRLIDTPTLTECQTSEPALTPACDEPMSAGSWIRLMAATTQLRTAQVAMQLR